MQRAHRWNLKFMAFAVSHVSLSLSVRAARTRRRQTRCLPWKANYTREKEKIVTRRRCRRRQNESASPAFSSGRLSGWRMAFFMHFKAAHVAQPGHTPHHVRVSEWVNDQHTLVTRVLIFFAGTSASCFADSRTGRRFNLEPDSARAWWFTALKLQHKLYFRFVRERDQTSVHVNYGQLSQSTVALQTFWKESELGACMKGQLSDSKALIQPPLDR